MESVEIISRRELRECPQCQLAFESQHKDSRYYENVGDTIHPEFNYLYFAVRDSEGGIRAIQPFFVVGQDVVAGAQVCFKRCINAIRGYWPRFLT
jgi:hypothetical protein